MQKNTRKQLIRGAEVNDPSALRDDRTTQGKKQQVMTVSREAGEGRRLQAPTGERHQVVVDDVEPRALPREELSQESNQTQTVKTQTSVR